MAARDDAAVAVPLHPHVQHLIDCAPPLVGQRRTELTALLLQAKATRAASRRDSPTHDEGAARPAAPVVPADPSPAAELAEVSRAG